MKNTASLNLFLISTRNKSWFWILIFITSYFIFTLSRQRVTQNFYDFMIETTEFQSLSYVIIPAYLIILINHFSAGEIQNYLTIRCTNRYSWYKLNLKTIAIITTIFILMIISIPLLLTIFVPDFSNHWSDSTLDSYLYHTVFLQHVSPVVYMICTFSLLWLLLFSLGIAFYLIYLSFRRPYISMLIIFFLNIANIAITTSKIDLLNQFFWTKRVNIFEYIYMTDASQHIIPFQIFLYWILLIVVLYGIGFIIVHRTDLDVNWSKSNDVH